MKIIFNKINKAYIVMHMILIYIWLTRIFSKFLQIFRKKFNWKFSHPMVNFFSPESLMVPLFYVLFIHLNIEMFQWHNRKFWTIIIKGIQWEISIQSRLCNNLFQGNQWDLSRFRITNSQLIMPWNRSALLLKVIIVLCRLSDV